MLGLNPWAIALTTLGVAAVVGGSGWQGYRMGRDSVIAAQARADQVRKETLQIAQVAAGKEFAKILTTHTSIRQTAEKVLRENPDYLKCFNALDAVGLLDAARANRPPAEPIGSSSVPGTEPRTTSDFW